MTAACDARRNTGETTGLFEYNANMHFSRIPASAWLRTRLPLTLSLSSDVAQDVFLDPPFLTRIGHIRIAVPDFDVMSSYQ